MSWRWVADVYPACWVWEQAALTPESRLQRGVAWHYNHGQTIEEREKGRERESEEVCGRYLYWRSSSKQQFCEDRKAFPWLVPCCGWHLIVMTCRYDYRVFPLIICTFRHLTSITAVCLFICQWKCQGRPGSISLHKCAFPSMIILNAALDITLGA